MKFALAFVALANANLFSFFHKSDDASDNDDVMSPKEHGTCPKPTMDDLRFGADHKTADRICCYNRRYAEFSGYWHGAGKTLESELRAAGQLTFYDAVTGKPLFEAPKGRSVDDFIQESMHHGWPSFRDAEVIWDNIVVLDGGETVSADGTHLGHNLPDRSGNRYCINLVSVAGQPQAEE